MNGSVSFLARTTTRSRRRSLLALVLLVAISGAAVLVAVAGARRTESAFDRLRSSTAAASVTVELERPDVEFVKEIRDLPGVEVASLLRSFAVVPSRYDFRPFAAPLDDAFGRTIDRSRLLEGRRVRPGATDEVVLSQSAARDLGLTVGDELRLRSFTPEQSALMMSAEGETDLAPEGPRLRLRVVGIEQRPIDVTSVGEATGVTFLPRALTAEYGDRIGAFGAIVRVELAPGTTPAEFGRAVRDLAGDRYVDFDSASIDFAGIGDNLNALATGLLVFAAIAAAGMLVAVGQVMARSAAGTAADQAALRELGMRRQDRALAIMSPLLAAGCAGGVGACVLAYALSGRMPIGIARRAEPHPGLSFDAAVLLVGAVVIAIATTALAVIAARHAVVAADRAARPGSDRALHPSRIASVLVRAGATPTTVIGVRMGLETGRGRAAVPVRAALVGATFGIAGVVAVLVVGASLQQLRETPERYGWNWDAVVVGSGGERGNPDVCEPHSTVLEQQGSVGAIASVCFASVSVDGEPVQALGFSPVIGSIEPSIVTGRAPTSRNEVALGADTLGAIGKSVGDQVRVSGSQRSGRFLVVGTAVFPTVEDPEEVGAGAVVSADALAGLGIDEFAGYHHFVVRWADGVDPVLAARRVGTVSGQAPALPTPPSDVERLVQLNRLPALLAVLLALLALLAVGQAIITNVHRRRHELALLRTLGFTRGQARRTVAWQATTLATVGALVGIPLGVIAGRLVWRAVARSIGVADDPATLLWQLALLLPLALLAANALAWFPARAAARTRPAVVLREE